MIDIDIKFKIFIRTVIIQMGQNSPQLKNNEDYEIIE